MRYSERRELFLGNVIVAIMIFGNIHMQSSLARFILKNMRHHNFLTAAIVTSFLLCLLLLAGCKSTTARYDSKTGDWRVSDRRFFLRTEAEITATLDDKGNKSVNIKAKSDPAAEAIKAAAEGAAAGVAKGLRP